jgi:hypothetical protein
MDTDSFVLDITTEDVFEDWKHEDLKDWIDWKHSNTLGLFKDEMEGSIMTEWVALKPKMYSYKFETENITKEQTKGKGIPKKVVKETLGFDVYLKTLEEQTTATASFNCIRHKSHRLYILGCEKIATTDFDNKRYYLNSVHSLPYGSIEIEFFKMKKLMEEVQKFKEKSEQSYI